MTELQSDKRKLMCKPKLTSILLFSLYILYAALLSEAAIIGLSVGLVGFFALIVIVGLLIWCAYRCGQRHAIGERDIMFTRKPATLIITQIIASTIKRRFR